MIEEKELNKVDRRHGKRPLPSDHASEEKREDFADFPAIYGQTLQDEEASGSPFSFFSRNNIPISNIQPGQGISNPSSGLIENQQDPSQQPTQQGN